MEQKVIKKSYCFDSNCRIKDVSIKVSKYGGEGMKKKAKESSLEEKVGGGRRISTGQKEVFLIHLL